jgi:ketosteroid isomerase-like protein
MAAVLEALDPNVDVEFTGPPGLPMAGKFVGHRGFQDYLGRVMGCVEWLEFCPEEYISQGDDVVVLGFSDVRARSSGREARLRWALVFTLSAGKIRRYRVYEDTATLAQALAGA